MAKPFQTIRPTEDDSRPELNFLCALFRQIIADAASTDPARREDVDRFLRVGGIAYWTEMMGLGDSFAEGLERAITAQLHPPPRRRI
jgi:hypothetical protein